MRTLNVGEASSSSLAGFITISKLRAGVLELRLIVRNIREGGSRSPILRVSNLRWRHILLVRNWE